MQINSLCTVPCLVYHVHNQSENIFDSLRFRLIRPLKDFLQMIILTDPHFLQMVILTDPRDEDDILRAKRSKEKRYMFDIAFDSYNTQLDVYLATTKPLISSVLDGFNATVFAYGPTGKIFVKNQDFQCHVSNHFVAKLCSENFLKSIE